MNVIDQNTWKRKEYFDFFSKMASPYFGITAEVECTAAYLKAKKEPHSFFASYLHKSMLAVNKVPELCTRILGEEVIQFSPIHAGSTIGRADGTFAFGYVDFSEDFAVFNAELQVEIIAVQNSTGLRLIVDNEKLDMIRHSTLPWHSFTALLHPTRLDPQESIPKITFGKASLRGDRYFMPVSIEAHHGLADGVHLCQYLRILEDLLTA